MKIDDSAEQEKDGWVQDREYAAELASADNLDPSRSHTVVSWHLHSSRHDGPHLCLVKGTNSRHHTLTMQTLTNYPSRNKRTTVDSNLGWFDVDYYVLTHHV